METFYNLIKLKKKNSTWLQPRTLSDFLFCMLTVSSPVLLLRHEAMHSA